MDRLGVIPKRVSLQFLQCKSADDEAQWCNSASSVSEISILKKGLNTLTTRQMPPFTTQQNYFTPCELKLQLSSDTELIKFVLVFIWWCYSASSVTESYRARRANIPYSHDPPGL